VNERRQSREGDVARGTSLFCFLLIVLASAVPALSQNAQTGTVTGRVSAGGGGLPGVTVGFESAALQGRREVVTQTNGDYISPFMPPGLYTVSFSMEGFKTLTVEVKVSTQQVRRLDAQMVDEAFEGEIEIVGTGETISQNISAQTTVPLEFQEKLAVDRSITTARWWVGPLTRSRSTSKTRCSRRRPRPPGSRRSTGVSRAVSSTC
jgi:hypothetical protein